MLSGEVTFCIKKNPYLVLLAAQWKSYSLELQETIFFISVKCDGEFRVVANAVCEIMWVKSLLKEMGLHLRHAPVVWSDNTSVIALFENPIHHSKMNHVEIDVFFIREKVHFEKSLSILFQELNKLLIL